MTENHVKLVELRIIDDVLEMGGGYVLDFSNHTFAEFMKDLGVEIDSPKYVGEGGSKAKRLRSFLKLEPPPVTGRVLAALLEYRNTLGEFEDVSDERMDQYREIASRLGGEIPGEAEQLRVTDEQAVFSHEFCPATLRGLVFLDAPLAEELCSRMEQASRCIDVECYLAAVILCGSVLEGLCLGAGSHNPKRTNSAFQQKFSKPAPQFHEWTLFQWIQVFEHLRDLSPNIGKFGHALREFRNYVHPRQQLVSGFVPDKHTARISFHVVAAAVDDFSGSANTSKQ